MRALAVLLALGLAGCVAPPTPRPAPTQPALPPRTPAPAAPPSDDWRDLPQSPGTWAYHGGGTVTEARFGVSDAAPSFVIRCERVARRVALERLTSSPVAASITITTTDARRVVSAASGPRGVMAMLAGGDPLLDRVAFSRGRFLVAVTGATTLALPSWGEVSRVIEDCRP